MFHVKPIPEKDATGEIQHLYKDILTMLQTSSVPTIFQYLANYPAYFSYAWDRIKEVEQTSNFQASTEQVINLSDAMVSVIYQKSSEMTDFVTKLHRSQKDDLLSSLHKIHLLNAKLTLITLGIRESIKGVPVGAKKLTAEGGVGSVNEEVMQDFVSEIITQTGTQEMTIASNLLVPMVGSTLPVLSDYPTFFALSAQDFEKLMKSEAYLKARVELEKLGHTLISGFSTSFHFSYVNTEKYLRNQPYLDELLFLLKDTFPSQYPRFVMTSSVMQKSLI